MVSFALGALVLCDKVNPVAKSSVGAETTSDLN